MTTSGNLYFSILIQSRDPLGQRHLVRGADQKDLGLPWEQECFLTLPDRYPTHRQFPNQVLRPAF